MGLTTEQIGVKMRLSGAAKYTGEMDAATGSTTAYGDSAERAGAQAKGASVGIGAMSAASKKGIGALSGMKKAGEGMKSLGSKMTSTFTVPMALIGGIGVKSALDFSDSMEQISTQAGASQKEVQMMTKAVMAFAASGQSAAGPNELAKGLFSIESAGFRGAKALDALKASEHLASVGHADFEKTAKAVAAAMATNIKGSSNLEELVGTLNSTVGVGSMRFEDLLSAMGTGLLDRSAALGLSLKEVGAALGTMTTVGQPAAASATRMSMAFNMMAAPTEKAKKAMEGIGLQSDTLALSLRKKGLIPTLETLKGRLDKTFGTTPKGLSEQANAISEMFGGGRTSGGITALMRHIDLLKTKQGELVGVVGKFKKAEEHTSAQPIVKLQTAWAQLQVVLIQIGNALIPVITKVAEFFVGVARSFSHLPKWVKTGILIIAGVLAVAGPLLSMIGTMTLGIYALASAFAALDVLASPVVLIIAGIVALAAVTYLAIRNFDTWGKYVLAVISPMTLLAMEVIKNWGAIKGFAQAVGSWLVGALQNVESFLMKLPGLILNAISKIPGIIWSALKKTPKLLLKFALFFAFLPLRITVYFVQLTIRAMQILSSWISKMPGIGLKVLTFLVNGLVTMVPRVLSFFVNLNVRILQFMIVTLPTKMFQVGVKGVTALVHGLVSAAPKIWGWIKALPGKFASAVASIVPQLLEIGGEIASAIAEGIMNELKSILPGPVISALEGAGGVAGEVGSTIGGGVSELFGGLSFNTPSSVLPDLGAIPGGFALPEATGHKHHKHERKVGPIRPHDFGRAVELDRHRGREDRGGGKKVTHVKIPVTLKVGKRKFGQAVADAYIEDESNG